MACGAPLHNRTAGKMQFFFRKALSDNQCFGPAMAGEGIYCVVEKKEKEK
jgi:hypothetical protein